MNTSPNLTPSHDPWWGESEDPLGGTAVAPIGFDAPRSRPRSRSRRRPTPIWVRVLILPIVLFGAAFRRWPRLRSLAIRMLIAAVVAGIVGGSVGVILLNNVVIRRTAELGKLDEERRELRRDNAVLGAQAARGSSQTQVVRRAQRMGMVRSGEAPHYTYLDPASVELTPAQRAARRRQAEARRARAAAAEQAAAAAPAKKEKVR